MIGDQVTVTYDVPERRTLADTFDHMVTVRNDNGGNTVTVQGVTARHQIILSGRLDQVVAVSAAVLFGSVQEALSYAVENGEVA